MSNTDCNDGPKDAKLWDHLMADIAKAKAEPISDNVRGLLHLLETRRYEDLPPVDPRVAAAKIKECLSDARYPHEVWMGAGSDADNMFLVVKCVPMDCATEDRYSISLALAKMLSAAEESKGLPFESWSAFGAREGEESDRYRQWEPEFGTYTPGESNHDQ